MRLGFAELRAACSPAALPQPNPEARPSAAQILQQHGTPERLAALPQPPAEDACGRPWDGGEEPQARSPVLLPPIDATASGDLASLNDRLPQPCCNRVGCRSLTATPTGSPRTPGVAPGGRRGH